MFNIFGVFMKYFLLLALLISTAQAQNYVSPTYQVGESLKVLTLNTWLIPFLRKKAKTRGRMIGKELQSYDIALLQEVFLRSDRKRILKYLNQGEYKYDNRYETGAFLKLNPGLFNLSRFKVVASSFLRFSDCLDEQCHVKKGVLHTRLKLNDTLEIDVFNGHFQPFGSGKEVRLKQMSETINFINKMNNDERPVLFVGDLNTGSSEVDLLEKLENAGFRDAWTTTRGTEPGYTWDSFVNLWSREIDRTKFSRVRFDYIFTRGSRDVSVEIESANIAFDKALEVKGRDEPMFISDHFGVEVNLRLLK